MDFRKEIIATVQKIIGEKEIKLNSPENEEFGDYAFFSKNAKEVAERLRNNSDLAKVVEKIEAMGSFVNLWLKKDVLNDVLVSINTQNDILGKLENLKGKKIMVEFAHPNTHKELHIGHMRTLMLGESLSRILQTSGVEVFRANYQGDIGPHVAKAIWGTRKILEDKGITWDETEKKDVYEKAHLLGEGYVLGNKDYEQNKSEIDDINTKIYQKDSSVQSDYERTRKWSLDYYDTFYKRFGTKFDRFYFESEVGLPGKEIVEKNIGKIFEKSEGAVIFDGEKYGLHKRVFITGDGNPTYEAKDMALAPLQFSEFPFDLNIHVVANEQKGYFQVIFKALELIDGKFKGREFHLPMGMVNLVGQKMSSRTGIIVTVDKLLEDIKKKIVPLIGKEISEKEKEEIAEIITIGAVKYSMLKVGPASEVLFDIKESIKLDGNSGPYLQYTYARTQSVLRKSRSVEELKSKEKIGDSLEIGNLKLEINDEEAKLLRSFIHFPEIVEEAAKNYAPNIICNYLYDLASKFNTFYNANKILVEDPDTLRLRLKLTSATGQILKTGLNLLGIESPEKM